MDCLRTAAKLLEAEPCLKDGIDSLGTVAKLLEAKICSKIGTVRPFCGLRNTTLALEDKISKVRSAHCCQRNVTLVLNAKNNVILNLLLEITVNSGVLNKYDNPNFTWPIYIR